MLFSIPTMKFRRNCRVSFNLSGEVFETYEKTLLRFPDTLLGNAKKRHQFYCLHSRQYYFDRSRLCFGAILYFYQSFGILSCPPDIPIDVFESECEFFGLPEDVVKKMKIKEGIIPGLNAKGSEDEEDEEPKACRAGVWDLFENPETSKAAMIYALISLIAIWLSILSACLETVPSLKSTSATLTEDPWAVMELVLNLFFLVELLARLVSSPCKKTFVRSSLNLVDAIAIIPYFFSMIFTPNKVSSLGFLRILRFVRVMRLFRLSKHSKKLHVVGVIIKSSLGDFQLLMVCLSMLIVLGGSLMYYIEMYNPEGTDFTSIPNSLWWAIQTITTVGYGDVVPLSLLGKLVAATFMAFGALTITLPVLSIVIKFMTIYTKNIEGDRLVI